MSASYRVRQFVRAIAAWLRPDDLAEASCYLSPAALELFRAMPHYDRHHALNVMRTLREQGYGEVDLLAAALLHDTGKTVSPTGRLRLWHRVVVVLMRALCPRLLQRLGQGPPGGWRRSFFVQQHHAALSAGLARQAGCSRRTVELIRCHEDLLSGQDDPLLAALQAADSVN